MVWSDVAAAKVSKATITGFTSVLVGLHISWSWLYRSDLGASNGRRAADEGSVTRLEWRLPL